MYSDEKNWILIFKEMKNHCKGLGGRGALLPYTKKKEPLKKKEKKKINHH